MKLNGILRYDNIDNTYVYKIHIYIYTIMYVYVYVCVYSLGQSVPRSGVTADSLSEVT